MEYILEADDDLKLHESQYEILCDTAHFDKVSDLLTGQILTASSGIIDSGYNNRSSRFGQATLYCLLRH